MKIMSSHQPNLFPYLGVWEKYLLCDSWTWADEVQFVNNDYQNRALVVGPKGEKEWVTIPVAHSDRKMFHDIYICSDSMQKVEQKVRGWYPKSKKSMSVNLFFNSCAYLQRLIDVNLKSIELVKSKLMYHPMEENFASKLSSTAKKTQKIIDDCKELECDVYISGSGGKNYLDVKALTDAGIRIVWQSFEPFEYSQWYRKDKEFLFGMSTLDMFLNSERWYDFSMRCAEKREQLDERLLKGEAEITMG